MFTFLVAVAIVTRNRNGQGNSHRGVPISVFDKLAVRIAMDDQSGEICHFIHCNLHIYPRKSINIISNIGIAKWIEIVLREVLLFAYLYDLSPFTDNHMNAETYVHSITKMKNKKIETCFISLFYLSNFNIMVWPGCPTFTYVVYVCETCAIKKKSSTMNVLWHQLSGWPLPIHM